MFTTNSPEPGAVMLMKQTESFKDFSADQEIAQVTKEPARITSSSSKPQTSISSPKTSMKTRLDLTPLHDPFKMALL